MESITTLSQIKGGQFFHYSYESEKSVSDKLGGGSVVRKTINARAHSKESYRKAMLATNPDYKFDDSKKIKHIEGHIYQHEDTLKLYIGISKRKESNDPARFEYFRIVDGVRTQVTEDEYNSFLPASKRTDYVSPSAANKALEAKESGRRQPPSFRFYDPAKLQVGRQVG